jgi:hypothetical protein
MSEDYVPASLEESLRNCCEILGRIHGGDPNRIYPAAEPGACLDGNRNGQRVLYGRVLVCRVCSAKRSSFQQVAA